jgi:predicted dehydrogenase
MNTVRVAVVGVGAWGQNHARVYHQLPQAQLVAVADANGARAAEVAAPLGTRAVSDYHELLGEVDAVSVAVPTALHYEVAREFLEAGVAVLLEKPMTRTVAEADELIALAGKRRVPLQVGHIERFNPVIRAMAELDITPKFIECQRLSPLSLRIQDVGVVFDLMIHDLDVVLHLVQAPIRKVDAVGVSVISEHEDIANARILFQTGCVANLTASRMSLRKVRRIRIFSPDSYISLDYDRKRGELYKASPLLRNLRLPIAGMKAETIADLRTVQFGDLLTIKEIEMDDAEPLRLELESFLDSVRSGTTPAVPGEQGRRAIAAAEQVLEAIRQHRWEGWTDEARPPEAKA